MRVLSSLLLMLVASGFLMGKDDAEVASKQVYEIRQFVLGEGQAGEDVDKYLSDVMHPALKRAGSGLVGVFAPADGEEARDRFLVIAYDSMDQVTSVAAKMRADERLTVARAEFESKAEGAKPYQRINSELLIAMDSMPMLKSPESVGTEATRVYELRVYESVNETMGDRKVEMFNEGEVPIFLDCGISPVFLGQAIAGPYTPSLTYLTAYPDNKAREESWGKFRKHPDWKVLSGKARYQGTVSKIYKFVLKPLPGSEL